ncbi:MAG: RNA polymerase factor sigma-54 [Nitrospirae bacterium]|nr:RNA polymerase factor sigma-54 [Nitrospirota bacterium]MDA1302893.1 RNA polymerase factor sigma-54 [Nitrospirota bacterium]
MELRLDLKLSQRLVMTPQLQQAIKLLQLSRLELQQTLSQHLMENPLLEEVGADQEEVESVAEAKEVAAADGEASGETETTEFTEPLSSEEWDNYYESDWRAGGASQSSPINDEDFPSFEQTLTRPASLEEHLLWQLRLSSVSEEEQAIGTVLIGNIDEDGYIRTSLEEIAEDTHASLHQVENALDLIQTFDPPGVAARDLQECLNIQLRHLHYGLVGRAHSANGTGPDSLLKTIIANHLTDLQKKRYPLIAKEVGVSLEEVYDAVHIIEGLEPKPGRPYFSDTNQIIIPDVFVFKDEGEWVVLLNEDGVPRVQISPYYKQMMSGGGDTPESTKVYLDDKIRGAQWIIRSLDQRNKTILKVVRSLIHFQEPFLDKGIQHLKPLVLKQVAEDVGMHESTISRVTTNKYMYCPQGMLELKFFFNAGIQRSDPGAEDLSSLTVRELIREMVALESAKKPLKDQEIVARLKHRGIIIARRTVAKYRAELNIAPASQRKRMPS